MDTIIDYGNNKGAIDYELFEPQSVSELTEKICLAYQQGTPIRIRANGHSMNSLSLPRSGELLISMTKLCRYRFLSNETITVEAGASVWDVNLMLKELGYELLVYNDGNAPASSLGGYLAAGGIGYTSNTHGGFWCSVDEVALLIGTGEILRFSRADPVFKWLFGSMGQLGIATEITLKIKPLKEAEAKHLIGLGGSVPRTTYNWEPIVWFTLFVPQKIWQVARAQLKEIGKRHKNVWKPRSTYTYFLPFREFNPPLIHTYQGDLVAVGLWGEALEGGFNWEAVEAIEMDIRRLIVANPKLYRRYVQAERIDPTYYQVYFDENVYRAFQELKSVFDPRGLFVVGVI